MARIQLNLPIKTQISRQARLMEGVVKGAGRRAIKRIITGKNSFYPLYDPSTYINGEEKAFTLLPSVTDIRQLLGVTKKEKTRYKSQFGVPTSDYFSLRKVKGEEFVDLTALVNVTRKKTIVLTNVEGRDRSRKEHVNSGDYMVTISGIISSGIPDVYPEDRVNLLIDMLNYVGVLSVDCPHLGRLGINGLVVLDYKLPQEAGVGNTQKYSMNCVFEKPIEFLRFEEKEQKLTLQKALSKVNEWVSLDLAVDSIYDNIM